MAESAEKETREHIGNVEKFLRQISMELKGRAAEHDKSKLTSPESETFDRVTPKLRGLTYGSPEYQEMLSEMKPALDHHYRNNRHHPEFVYRNEEWKTLEDNLHCISNKGRVKRLKYIAKRSGTTGNCAKPELIKKSHVTPEGYARLQINGKNVLIHMLVAKYFLGLPPNDRAQVNHKDGDKLNNCVENLEWVTPSQSLQHAYDTGLRKPCVKYVVHCEELDITTFGIEKMCKKLWEAGYVKATSGGIWRCITSEGPSTHLDLTLTSYTVQEFLEMNSPVNDMNLIDLIEMLADWKAATLRHEDGDITKSIKHNAERFNLSPQLERILLNTVPYLGW